MIYMVLHCNIFDMFVIHIVFCAMDSKEVEDYCEKSALFSRNMNRKWRGSEADSHTQLNIQLIKVKS